MISLRLTVIGALLGLGVSAPTPAHAIPIDPAFPEAMHALQQVHVTSFTRSPAVIGPWGSARLSWVVEGSDDLLDLELGGRRVPFRGSLVVAPRSTTAYGLIATTRGVTRGLGSRTVTVDRSACDSYPLFGAGNLMAGLLGGSIEKPLYLRGGREPEVTFEPGQIRIRLWLGKDLDNKPDPSIDIDALVSLYVDGDGHLRPGTFVGVKASLPWWAEHLPGASARLRAGERQARVKMTEAIRDLVAALDSLYAASSGTRRQDVVVDADGIRVWECAAPATVAPVR